jgi:integrase
VACQRGSKPERQHDAGGRITSAGAHHSEAGKPANDGDQYEADSELRRVSRHWRAVEEDGRERVANFVFDSSRSKVLGLCCGNFKLADITMPREGIKKEQRCFTDEEVGKIIAAAPEPFGTVLAVTSVLGLRIGETLALRVTDIDFTKHVIRIRQSVDAATRIPQAVKSNASSADVPMPSQLETRLRALVRKHDGKSDLLFINRRGRPFSANKLREKQLHPLLVKLGIPRGGFHSMRHGAASALLADGATPAVVQRQLRHSDARITLGLYGHVVGDQQRNAVENRSTRIAEYGVN